MGFGTFRNMSWVRRAGWGAVPRKRCRCWSQQRPRLAEQGHGQEVEGHTYPPLLSAQRAVGGKGTTDLNWKWRGPDWIGVVPPGCAISILGGLQDLGGPSSEQLGWTPELPLLGQEVQPETSWDLFSPELLCRSIFFSFYDTFLRGHIACRCMLHGS